MMYQYSFIVNIKNLFQSLYAWIVSLNVLEIRNQAITLTNADFLINDLLEIIFSEIWTEMWNIS